MTTPPAVQLTTAAAAAHLGVSASTLRRWAQDGRVRHILMPSGRMRFDPADLDAYLAPRGASPLAHSA